VQADVIFEGGKEMPNQNELLKKAQGTVISYCDVKHLTVICALRNVFGTNTVKVAEGCMKLRKWVPYNFYSSQNSISLVGLSDQFRRYGLGM
jgi:hypothetical protein